ncbi:MAG: DUF504 domain-containing protein [Nanoarchaeota archaeon]
MISCFNVLNKIKWDKALNPNEYSLIYLDFNKKVEIKFNEIKEISKNFISLQDKEIPLHRIKEIRKNNKIIWKR